jgi:integrase
MAAHALALFRPDETEEPELLVGDAVEKYLEETKAADRTRSEYRTTVRKLAAWQAANSHRSQTPMRVGELLDRSVIKSILDWVYSQAEAKKESNPGRTANKSREHLHAVLTWLAKEEFIAAGSVPRFPDDREQKEAAGLFFLNEAQLNALYWSAYNMPRPHVWRAAQPIGAFWRAALSVWFTYGVDTQTVFPYDRQALPLRWRHVYWEPPAPDQRVNMTSEWGWLFYERKKTGRAFMRPMTREVHLHLRAIAPAALDPESPVFGTAGGSRPCERFQELVELAKLPKKREFPSQLEFEWTLKDLRKTCATWHEENLPGSASVILGHSLGASKNDGRAAVTYKHYANVSPLEYRAITTLPYPAAFRSIWDESIKPTSDLLFAK